MKTIKILILIVFLFASQTYPCFGAQCNLRAPLISADRLKDATEQVAKRKLSLWQRLTLREWEKLIYEKYGIEEEAKQALSIMKPFIYALDHSGDELERASKVQDELLIIEAANNINELKLFADIGGYLVENKVHPTEIILLVAKSGKTAEERKVICDILVDLYKELKYQKIDFIYGRYVSEKAIPAVFKAAKDAHEVAMFLGFGLERAMAKQDIGPTLYGISQAVKIAHTREEKREVCDIMAELNEKSLRRIFIDPGKLMEVNFIIANTVSSISELSQVKGTVDKIKEKTMGNSTILASLTPQHIGEAMRLQKQEGDFDINLTYMRGGYKIEIVPASRPTLAAAPIASGHTLTGQNILIIQDYDSIIDARKFQLTRQGAKEENITVALDYKTAITALNTKRFDLIILDMSFNVPRDVNENSKWAGLSVLEYIVSNGMLAPVLIDSSAVLKNLGALHKELETNPGKYPNLAKLGKDKIDTFARVFPEADNLQQFLQRDLNGLRSAL